MTAKIKRLPPSPCISIPKNNKCDKIAPAMIPKASNAPKSDVLFHNRIMPANNSITPVPILPQGSKPKFENIWTLTGAAVNLKYKVCNKINAARILSNRSM